MSDRDLILAGKHLLIVDDEPLLAFDLAELLSVHGASIVGPHHNLADAIRCVEHDDDRIDCALLDIQLGQDLVWPLADLLSERGIPHIFISAQCGSPAIADRLAGRPCLAKPVSTKQLRATIDALVLN